MNNVSKALLFIVLIIGVNAFESCTQLKKVDSTVRKTFGQVNRFKRQKNLYSRRLGLNENKANQNQDTALVMARNPIQQKNMINEYGYVFESLNGFDPGVIVSYNRNDSISNVFEIQKSTYKTIKENKEVFGWHPYWMGSSWKQYPFELLSTLSYFAYTIDPSTGLNQNPEHLEDWKTSALIDSAKSKNTRILLTVSLDGESNQRLFLNNPLLWNNLYNDVSKHLLEKDADGIDINFEDIPSSYSGEFVSFVEGFDQFLRTQFQNSSKPLPFISMTLPAWKDRKSYAVNSLDKVIDLFIIMGYDYNGTNSPDAVAPLQASGEISLLKTLEYYRDQKIDFSKTILALPYYGILWNITPDEEDGVKASVDRRLTYSEIKNVFLNNDQVSAEVELDPVSMSKVYRVAFEDNTMKEIHFDDAFTLSKKYDFAMNNNLKGVGMWALGYDNGQKELWALIENYFSTNKIVYTDPISEVNGFPIRFAKTLVLQKDVFIAMIIFLTFALVVAFIIVLFRLAC
jgi:spore germination protein YaaH